MLSSLHIESEFKAAGINWLQLEIQLVTIFITIVGYIGALLTGIGFE